MLLLRVAERMRQDAFKKSRYPTLVPNRLQDSYSEYTVSMLRRHKSAHKAVGVEDTH
jgi:hypothetical protein